MEWPTERLFYVYAFLAAIPAVVGDIILYNATARFGGAPVARLLPLRILLLYLAWGFLYPDAIILQFTETPLKGLAIAICLLVSVAALIAARRAPFDRGVFNAVLPIVISYVIMDIFYKPAASLAPTFPNALAFGFILCLMMSVISGGYVLITGRMKRIISPDANLIKSGIVIGFVYIFVILGKNLALIGTPNPAYFNAICMLSAIWLTFYHKAFSLPDDSSLGPILVFLIATIALILLNA